MMTKLGMKPVAMTLSNQHNFPSSKFKGQSSSLPVDYGHDRELQSYVN